MTLGRLSRLTLCSVSASLLLNVLALAAPLEPPGDRIVTAALPDTAAVDPEARAVAKRDGTAPVTIRLNEQADVSAANLLDSKVAKGRYVYERLTEVADRTQPELVTWLESQGVATTSLTLVNAVAGHVSPRTLQLLGRHPDVAAVTLVPQDQLHSSESQSTGVRVSPYLDARIGQAPMQARMEKGLVRIGVREVWKQGYKGKGAVVAVIDTGVVHNHRALRGAYRGPSHSRPGNYHDYHWRDTSDHEAVPADDHGHGTHVTGIAVGSTDGTGRSIGVAPEAKFIACRKSTGLGPMQCLDWSLAPTRVDGSEPRPDMAPDIVNASWSSGRPGQCDETDKNSLNMQIMVENLAAAGILVVSSAGNSGGCGNICPPSSSPVAITVANFDVAAEAINSLSSGGPVRFFGIEIPKPDLAAPGVQVLSANIPEGFRRGDGTSAASPHVAGAAAILLSARPDLRGNPRKLKRILESSAERLEPARICPGEDSASDNVAGHGLLRIDHAVGTALAPTLTPSATPIATATPTKTRYSTGTSTATSRATETPGASSTLTATGLSLYLPCVRN